MGMVETVKVERISFATLFKIIYIGNLIFPSILLVILSVFSFFGFEVLRFGDSYLLGMEGLIKGLLTVPFMFLFALVWTIFFWTSYMISLWIYSKWRPMNLSFIPARQSNKDFD
jgi:hypothetical protein